MRRFSVLLEWLNHSGRPPEAQSPFKASAVVCLLSFVFIFALDHQIVSSLQPWWEQLVIYAVVPVLLAFIILYRSSWHQEIRSWTRSPLLVLISCLVFGSALVAAGLIMLLAALVYACYVKDFTAFH
jgi:threonine/homoserine/homoserine lactone efflux protein